MFEIRNYKSLSSGAYTATLYKDGKRVATVEDDGRGGEPRIWPTAKDATWRDRDEVVRHLTAWAKSSLPEWYLTGHGTFPTLTATWELGLGYLIECVEMNRLAKTKKVIVRGAQVYTMNPAAPHRPTDLVWSGSDWATVAI